MTVNPYEPPQTESPSDPQALTPDFQANQQASSDWAAQLITAIIVIPAFLGILAMTLAFLFFIVQIL